MAELPPIQPSGKRLVHAGCNSAETAAEGRRKVPFVERRRGPLLALLRLSRGRQGRVRNGHAATDATETSRAPPQPLGYWTGVTISGT